MSCSPTRASGGPDRGVPNPLPLPVRLAPGPSLAFVPVRAPSTGCAFGPAAGCVDPSAQLRRGCSDTACTGARRAAGALAAAGPAAQTPSPNWGRESARRLRRSTPETNKARLLRRVQVRPVATRRGLPPRRNGTAPFCYWGRLRHRVHATRIAESKHCRAGRPGETGVARSGDPPPRAGTRHR